MFSKKILTVLLAALAISQSVKAKNDELDIVLDDLKLSSEISYVNYYKLEKLKLEQLKYQTAEWNGMDLKLAYEEEDVKSSGNESNTKTGTLQLSYNIFNYELDYNSKTKKVNSNEFGVQKRLTDFINNDNKHNANLLLLKQKLQNLTNQNSLNTEIKNYIELYGTYTYLSKALKLRETEKNKLQIETEKLRLQYMARQILEADYMYSLSNLRTVENEIDILKNRKALYLNEMKNKAKVIPDNFNLESVDAVELISKIGEVRMEMLELERVILEKEKEYSIFNERIPKVDFFLKYETEEKNSTIGLAVSKDILSKNYDKEIYQSGLNENNFEKKILEKELIYEKKSTEFEILNYQKQIDSLQHEIAYLEKKVSELHMKYEQGQIEYYDYSEEFSEKIEKELELFKAEIELKVYIKKIEYRG